MIDLGDRKRTAGQASTLVVPIHAGSPVCKFSEPRQKKEHCLLRSQVKSAD
jgi:hypothetical protein